MTIKTIDKKYHAILKLHGSPDIQAYLCACGDTPDGKTVLLMGITDRKLSEKFLPFLMNLPKQNIMGGLKDTFVKDKTVWIVSDYFSGKHFHEKVKEELPTEEKIALASALVEQIFAQNLPVYLQYEALHPENIVVNASRGVLVNFLLFAPELLDIPLFPDVQKRLFDCLFILFQNELRNEACAELKKFIDILRTSSFSSEAELFGAFRQMSSALQITLSEGKLIRKGLLLRLWNNTTKHTAFLASVMYWMFIGALSGLLIFVCIAPETAPAQRNLIQNIGTLQITHLPPVESTGADDGTPDTESIPVEGTDSTEDETLQIPTQDTQSTEKETLQPEMG